MNAFGVPEGIRTPDLLVRSQTLYPAELQAQTYLLHKLPNYNIIINIKRQAFFLSKSYFFYFYKHFEKYLRNFMQNVSFHFI